MADRVTSRVVLAAELHQRIMAHLLPAEPVAEEAAFLFARVQDGRAGLSFEHVELFLVPPELFHVRSLYRIELADECRGYVIKRAHDLGASIIEFHSHPFPYEAEFSPSDRRGLAEFVPHVRWRLRGRPYGAVVVAPGSFDSLVWNSVSNNPTEVAVIQVGHEVVFPTGLSIKSWYERDRGEY